MFFFENVEPAAKNDVFVTSSLRAFCKLIIVLNLSLFSLINFNCKLLCISDMGKVSLEDKLRIQTLREQKLGAKAIVSAYPGKRWSLTTVKRICRLVDKGESATERKAGSGRPRSARTEENVAEVSELICSQEGASGTHASIREIASELNIGRSSVHRIAKKDLKLNAFRRVPVQVLSDATRVKRLQRARALLRRLKVRDVKRIFFTDEKKTFI